MECESKNRCDWNHSKITQTTPEQHTGEASTLGTAHKLREMLIQKYKTYFTGKITLHVAQTVNTEQLQHCIYRTNTITCSTDCKYRTAAT